MFLRKAITATKQRRSNNNNTNDNNKRSSSSSSKKKKTSNNSIDDASNSSSSIVTKKRKNNNKKSNNINSCCNYESFCFLLLKPSLVLTRCCCTSIQIGRNWNSNNNNNSNSNNNKKKKKDKKPSLLSAICQLLLLLALVKVNIIIYRGVDGFKSTIDNVKTTDDNNYKIETKKQLSLKNETLSKEIIRGKEKDNNKNNNKNSKKNSNKNNNNEQNKQQAQQQQAQQQQVQQQAQQQQQQQPKQENIVLFDTTIIISTSLDKGGPVIPNAQEIIALIESIEKYVDGISIYDQIPIIIAIDGQDHNKYYKSYYLNINTLDTKYNNNNNIKILEGDKKYDMIGNLKRAIDLVTTTYVYVLYQQIPFKYTINHNKLIQSMKEFNPSNKLRCIKFRDEQTNSVIINKCTEGIYNENPIIQSTTNDLKFYQSNQFFDTNQLATKSYYQDLFRTIDGFPQQQQQGSIAELMSTIVSNNCRFWGQSIYPVKQLRNT